jgi:hypothetical protein
MLNQYYRSVPQSGPSNSKYQIAKQWQREWGPQGASPSSFWSPQVQLDSKFSFQDWPSSYFFLFISSFICVNFMRQIFHSIIFSLDYLFCLCSYFFLKLINLINYNLLTIILCALVYDLIHIGWKLINT